MVSGYGIEKEVTTLATAADANPACMASDRSFTKSDSVTYLTARFPNLRRASTKYVISSGSDMV